MASQRQRRQAITTQMYLKLLQNPDTNIIKYDQGRKPKLSFIWAKRVHFMIQILTRQPWYRAVNTKTMLERVKSSFTSNCAPDAEIMFDCVEVCYFSDIFASGRLDLQVQVLGLYRVAHRVAQSDSNLHTRDLNAKIRNRASRASRAQGVRSCANLLRCARVGWLIARVCSVRDRLRRVQASSGSGSGSGWRVGLDGGNEGSAGWIRRRSLRVVQKYVPAHQPEYLEPRPFAIAASVESCRKQGGVEGRKDPKASSPAAHEEPCPPASARRSRAARVVGGNCHRKGELAA
ncbi:hypothetical protein B0H13DRAFT_1901795 [Mycena leptocephala]|nr:hypothetical protein B0H13DRAFT_1901795 [Mycena leptocephala]